MRTIKNLVGAALIAIAIFLFWTLILPDYDGRAYLEASIAAREANLEAKNSLINKTSELDKQYQSKYAELKRLSLVVPSQKHIEEMITMLESIFTATGVPLKDMALSAGEGAPGSAFSLVSMQFNFNASYDSIFNFLYAIEKSLRLIDTTTLNIGINQEESTGSGPPNLTVLFKATAYFVTQEAASSNTVQKDKSAAAEE